MLSSQVFAKISVYYSRSILEEPLKINETIVAGVKVSVRDRGFTADIWSRNSIRHSFISAIDA